MFQFFLIWKIVIFLKVILHSEATFYNLNVITSLAMLEKVKFLVFDIPHMWPIQMQCIFVNSGPLESGIQDFSNGNVNKKNGLLLAPCVGNISNLTSITSASKFIVKCNILGLKKNFQRLRLECFFPKLANMPPMMRKFVRTLNMYI
jgi:hypothetical protein